MNATSNNLARFWPWLAVFVFAAQGQIEINESTDEEMVY